MAHMKCSKASVARVLTPEACCICLLSCPSPMPLRVLYPTDMAAAPGLRGLSSPLIRDIFRCSEFLLLVPGTPLVHPAAPWAGQGPETGEKRGPGDAVLTWGLSFL